MVPSLVHMAMAVVSLSSPVVPTWENPFASVKWPTFKRTTSYLPEQVHITLGPSAHQVAVMWASYRSGDTAWLHYGEGKHNFTQRAPAQKAQLYAGNLLGCQAHYRALLTGSPGRTFSYKVQVNEHFSPEFSFHLYDGDNMTEPLRLIVYGDLGRIGGSRTLRKLVQESETHSYDAFLHVGDFAYNLDFENGLRGDTFMRRLQKVAANTPYIVVTGNHERAYEFAHFRHRFSLPSDVPWPIPLNRMWYSLNLKRVHLIGYSTEVYFFTPQYAQLQRDWLEEDLRKANEPAQRLERPWIVAFGHRPMYCSNVNRDDCTKSGNMSIIRRELEELFYKYGVDLIIEAHEHSYERFYPLYNGTVTQYHYVNPSAPVHVIAGSAGCNENGLVCADVSLGPAGPWSAWRVWLPGLNGYGRMTVWNSTHLTWHQVVSLTGAVEDSFTIVQHNHSTRGPLTTQHGDHSTSGPLN